MQYRLWQPCRFETTQCNSLVNSSNRVLQVQVVDQTTHPPKCHSFVGLDRQIGSSPPANVKRFPANVKRLESVLQGLQSSGLFLIYIYIYILIYIYIYIYEQTKLKLVYYSKTKLLLQNHTSGLLKRGHARFN